MSDDQETFQQNPESNAVKGWAWVIQLNASLHNTNIHYTEMCRARGSQVDTLTRAIECDESFDMYLWASQNTNLHGKQMLAMRSS